MSKEIYTLHMWNNICEDNGEYFHFKSSFAAFTEALKLADKYKHYRIFTPVNCLDISVGNTKDLLNKFYDVYVSK